ncbi:MAG: hypothetical protein NVS4B2_23270 [Chloroflexota bacterium]
MPAAGDLIWAREKGGRWRAAIWQEVKGDDRLGSPDRVFVTFEDTGLGGVVSSLNIQLRTGEEQQPPLA